MIVGIEKVCPRWEDSIGSCLEKDDMVHDAKERYFDAIIFVTNSISNKKYDYGDVLGEGY